MARAKRRLGNPDGSSGQATAGGRGHETASATHRQLALVSGPPAGKSVTYQALCRVKGKLRFAVLRETSADAILDEVVIESPKVEGDYVFSDTTLVTLRALVRSYELAVVDSPVIVVENLQGAARTDWQVFWQQAWGDGWHG